MMNGKEKQSTIRTLAIEFSEETESDVLFYSGDLESSRSVMFSEEIRANHKNENVILFLSTHGGDPDAAYRMGRSLQNIYHGQFSIFVDYVCKSSGTLLALGADEIIMSDKAELGPLDIQVSKPDELDERISGLIPIQSLNTLQQQVFQHFEDFFLKLRFRSSLQIATRTAAEVAAKLTTGLFSSVYQQLDPMRLGEIQRAMMIGHEYGVRLQRGNLKKDALTRLIATYPSHGFIIDRNEASELFKCVREPDEKETELAHRLTRLVVKGLTESIPVMKFLSKSKTDRRKDKGCTHEKNGEPTGAYPSKGANDSESGSHSGTLAGNSIQKPPGPDSDQIN